MLLLSLNIRGTGGVLKLASFWGLLDKVRPNIVFLQKTLVHAEKYCAFFNLLRPRWHCCAVNSMGKSGGLLVSWDPNYFELIPYLTCGGMLLTGLNLESKRHISFLNIYGPCSERKPFWERLEKFGLLAKKNLVLVGDLNLTLSYGDIWGGTHTLGTLARFFINYFYNNKVIDIVPGTLVPTWRNDLAGTESISKRLDRALISEDLLALAGVYRAWVEFPYIFDHALIVLQLDSTLSFKDFSFKFNPLWSTDRVFIEMV
jgi:hypothetical protein